MGHLVTTAAGPEAAEHPGRPCRSSWGSAAGLFSLAYLCLAFMAAAALGPRQLPFRLLLGRSPPGARCPEPGGSLSPRLQAGAALGACWSAWDRGRKTSAGRPQSWRPAPAALRDPETSIEIPSWTVLESLNTLKGPSSCPWRQFFFYSSPLSSPLSLLRILILWLRRKDTMVLRGRSEVSCLDLSPFLLLSVFRIESSGGTSDSSQSIRGCAQ